MCCVCCGGVALASLVHRHRYRVCCGGGGGGGDARCPPGITHVLPVISPTYVNDLIKMLKEGAGIDGFSS